MAPLVSVMMLVYNHEKYLAQALDSILMQKGDFSMEIVIGDDCSTDSSPIILERYKSAYPDLIKIIRHRVNIGAMNNHKSVMAACNGKFVAICEGDDYWTDENKLQLQVTTLEDDPFLSFSCHRVTYFYEDEKRNEEWGGEYFDFNEKSRRITIDSLFDPYLVRTVSIVYRASMIDNKTAGIQPYFKDLFLFAMLLSHGDALFLNNTMAVYRIHGQGIWSGQNNIKNLESNVRTAISMVAYFKGKYEVIDNYAFVQSENLFNSLTKGEKKNSRLAGEIAGKLAFKLKGKVPFGRRLKYIFYWLAGNRLG